MSRTVIVMLSEEEAREVVEVLAYATIPTMAYGGEAVDAALRQSSARRTIENALRVLDEEGDR